MDFTRVIIIDWHGVLGEYDIQHLVKREEDTYSCTFINSAGETEKVLVSKKSLR